MSDPTGYRESPDTSDGLVTEDQTAGSRPDQDQTDDSTLTTDDEAQHDDGVVRPGNAPD